MTEPPVPIEEIAEAEGLQIAYEELSDEMSGALIREPRRALLVVNVTHHENRRRFTLAHELGHYLLHKSQLSVFADEKMVQFRSEGRGNDVQEAEANRFAAAVLMPKRWIVADLRRNRIDAMDEEAVKRFARRYKVSPQALTIRLVALGLVDS